MSARRRHWLQRCRRVCSHSRCRSPCPRRRRRAAPSCPRVTVVRGFLNRWLWEGSFPVRRLRLPVRPPLGPIIPTGMLQLYGESLCFSMSSTFPFLFVRINANLSTSGRSQHLASEVRDRLLNGILPNASVYRFRQNSFLMICTVTENKSETHKQLSTQQNGYKWPKTSRYEHVHIKGSC